MGLVSTPMSPKHKVMGVLAFLAGLSWPLLSHADEQEAIKKQIGGLASRAKERGFAIGICHYRYNTLKVLNEEIPRLKDEGYWIVSLDDLID